MSARASTRKPLPTGKPGRVARRRLLSLSLLALVAALGLGSATVASAAQQNPASAAGPASARSVVGGSGLALSGSTVLGAASGAVLLPPDAHGVRYVDIPTTVGRLAEAHVNTYAFLIHGEVEWNVLPDFLTAAAAQDIDVWAYIVPPSESTCEVSPVPYGSMTPCIGPYDWDYAAWADAIATLSAAHPNLTAILIDDFAGNTVEGGSPYSFAFTQSYVASMMASARAINPGLKLYTVMYTPQLGPDSTLYKEEVDGYVFPYTHWPTNNTAQYDTAEAQARLASSVSKCDEGDGCLQLMYASGAPSVAGRSGSASQTVSITPAASHVLTFSVASGNTNTPPAGYQYLQMLVNGTVVWQQDVATATGWNTHSVDITAAVGAASTATITPRLYHAAAMSSYWAAGWFDDLHGTNMTFTNGDFEASSLTSWSTSTSNANFTVSRARTQDIFLMPYANLVDPYPGTIPDESYVKAVSQIGLGLVDEGIYDGVMPWYVNLTYQPQTPANWPVGGDDGSIQVLSELYDSTGSGCSRLNFPSGVTSVAGWYGGIRQTVSIQNASTAAMTVWLKDVAANTAGYVFMQILVGGNVVWEADVASRSGWTPVTVDLASAMAGQTTTSVEFRIAHKAAVSSFYTDFFVDDVQATGFTVADPRFVSSSSSPWQFVSNGTSWSRAWLSAASCA